ncbi:MAG: histidine phosphatase family protein [Planctomycetaceae bacterium]|nr:histidine phosphatase family protein [Planctomycetaceae bacterium]
MRLLLIRHARAAASHHFPDAERPLTEEGRREFAAVARSIVLRGVTPSVIFHSPTRRTTETAMILATAAELPDHARDIALWLSLGTDCQEILPRLAALSADVIALVGHEPIMSSLTSLLIGGGGSSFSPGTSACVEFDGTIAPGQGRLLWTLEPR